LLVTVGINILVGCEAFSHILREDKFNVYENKYRLKYVGPVGGKRC